MAGRSDGIGVERVLGRWLAIAVESVRAAFSHMRREWWRTGNHLPGGSPIHLAWRLETAYGSSETDPAFADVIDFLEWRRRQRKARS